MSEVRGKRLEVYSYTYFYVILRSGATKNLLPQTSSFRIVIGELDE
ncbi:MAG: hypothetical protein GX227_02645 [Clostridiaceae bacterium]|nr:hypothetical protein [Clostridiaceae bacterium]